MKAAVLGSPIAHSLSPALHRAAYRELGLAGWSYAAIECAESGLPDLLEQCGPDWAGLSLTMPLKRTVLPLLDWTEPLAGVVGAANTVVFAAGQRRGYNTDVVGIVAAVTGGSGPGGAGNQLAGDSGTGDSWPEDPGEVLILGGGATACSALVAVRALGGSQITVAVRDPATAGSLLEVADRLGVTIRLTGFGTPAVPGPGLLISTVPAGAADGWAAWIATGAVRPRVLLDVVYHPWPTALVTAAQAAGAVTVGGLDMLVHQAAAQVELMTGQRPPVAEMYQAGLAERAARETGAGAGGIPASR